MRAYILKKVLEELRGRGGAPMQLICDNQAALYIALNPIIHEKTKHIEVNCRSLSKNLSQGALRQVLSTPVVS